MTKEEKVNLTDKEKELCKTLSFLFGLDVKSGEHVICENGHSYIRGKYDVCPICGSELRTMTLDDCEG